MRFSGFGVGINQQNQNGPNPRTRVPFGSRPTGQPMMEHNFTGFQRPPFVNNMTMVFNNPGDYSVLMDFMPGPAMFVDVVNAPESRNPPSMSQVGRGGRNGRSDGFPSSSSSVSSACSCISTSTCSSCSCDDCTRNRFIENWRTPGSQALVTTSGSSSSPFAITNGFRNYVSPPPPSYGQPGASIVPNGLGASPNGTNQPPQTSPLPPVLERMDIVNGTPPNARRTGGCFDLC